MGTFILTALEIMASVTQSQPSYQGYHICRDINDTLTFIRLLILELVDEAGPVMSAWDIIIWGPMYL